MTFEEGCVSLPLTPSIVDILSYLSHKEIANARFVNRRMNDVIKRNEVFLDRPTVSLEIWFHYEHVTRKPFVYLFYYVKDDVNEKLFGNINVKKRLCRFFITDERIRLLDYPPAMLQFLLEKVSPLPHDNLNYGERAAWKQITAYHPYKRYLDFEIESIENGLQLVIEILLRRFTFLVCCLKNRAEVRPGSRNANWVEIVMEEFVRSRNRCVNLEIEKEFSGMERFYTTLGSSVCLTPSPSANIKDLLFNQRFDRKFMIKYYVPLAVFEELMQRWTSGVIPSIEMLYIKTKRPYSTGELLRVFVHLPVITFVRNLPGSPDLAIIITNNANDKYLGITYPSYGLIQIEEFPPAVITI